MSIHTTKWQHCNHSSTNVNKTFSIRWLNLRGTKSRSHNFLFYTVYYQHCSHCSTNVNKSFSTHWLSLRGTELKRLCFWWQMATRWRTSSTSGRTVMRSLWTSTRTSSCRSSRSEGTGSRSESLSSPQVRVKVIPINRIWHDWWLYCQRVILIVVVVAVVKVVFLWEMC